MIERKEGRSQRKNKRGELDQNSNKGESPRALFFRRLLHGNIVIWREEKNNLGSLWLQAHKEKLGKGEEQELVFTQDKCRFIICNPNGP